MGVIKKKPYEISIWEDRLVTVPVQNVDGAGAKDETTSYYKEIKLAVIGSDTMESPNRAFDPVLIENVNGEKTLTFSLAYRYYDEYEGEIITNPFYPYLINERKVKLFYNNEWFEFLIKECEETAKENIFKYTAKELFSLELSKLGYNVTLNTDLNNNQGTVTELAKRVLEDTDWEVDEENSDLLTQYVQEPLYQVTVAGSFDAINLDTNELETITTDKPLYVFRHYIANQETQFVQFICEKDRKNFFIDDDNVIKSTNYRFPNAVEYTTNEQGKQVIKIDENTEAIIGDIYLSNQGYRLVYKIRTTYDPVMDRTVEIYQVPYDDGVQEIYHFLDYNYTTSDVVIPYITNGSNFQLYDDGDLQGWYNTTPVSSEEEIPTLQPIRVTTYPELSSDGMLSLVESVSDINGYIELKFKGTLTDQFENTYFNEGFENCASMIDHVSAGEKFVLRTRYYTSTEKHGDLFPGTPIAIDEVPKPGIRVIVAQYETEDFECYLQEEKPTSTTEGSTESTSDSKARVPSRVKAFKIIPDTILLNFDGEFVLSPNIIKTGTFNNDYTQYLVDRVVQVPSTSYIYESTNEEDAGQYIWHSQLGRYIPTSWTTEDIQKQYGTDYDIVPFANYYLTSAPARYSLTNEQMSDPTFKMGIFVYTEDEDLVGTYTYLQDIQLTRYYEDADGQIVTLGNVPTAISNEAHHYYLKPNASRQSKEINTYGSLDFLAAELGIDADKITPLFNDNSEKILSIQAEHSNYFNILQSLCETFECWLDIKVEHDEDGSITLDKDYNPIKRVAFKEYAGKDNFAGFKNGINLEGITRQIDSNEIVTKMIVEPVQSEYTDKGTVSIQYAKNNPSGESNIINFSYYLNRGLITDVDACNADLQNYYAAVNERNQKIQTLETEFEQLSNSLLKITANRNTYTALIDEAEKKHNEALVRFTKLTNFEYDAFVTKYHNIEEWARAEEDKAKNYLDNGTILDTIGEIYITAVTLNNYSGILTNLDNEYQDLLLKCYGAKEYGISTVFIPGDGEVVNPSTQVTIDDYISGLKFKLTDINGAEVVFQSSPNGRVFNASNSVPYQYITFIEVPSNYTLKYYTDNKIYSISEKSRIPFSIYDEATGETLNRRFVLVPTEEYAEAHKGYQQLIDDLIAEKSQIEKEFYKKYSRFLEEGTWSSKDYIDSDLYYFDALQVSSTSAQPKVSYTIDVLEISQIEGFENYDFRVGDKTYIEDTEFFGYLYQAVDTSAQSIDVEEGTARAPLTDGNSDIVIARTPVREEVIVSAIEWHFDEPDNNTITIQNYKTRFEDLFQRISATVQQVQRNEITYPKTSSILDQSGLINSTLLADSLNGVGGLGFALTSNGTVTTTPDGLLVRDLVNPANMMRLVSTGIQISTDGGTNWGTALNAQGISTDTLTAGTINTQRIWLMDGDNPSFRWDKSGLNAYGLDENGNNAYDLKTYVRFDKYGLYGIKNDEEYVASSLDDVRNKAFFGVTWNGFFIKNSYTDDGEVSITSDDDIVVRKGNVKRIHIGAVEKDATGVPTEYGIKIRNDNNEVVFETGDDGNLAVSGTINALAGNFTGQVNVGNPDSTHIIIDGGIPNPVIQSSNYSDCAGTGWIIDSNGDATFSNVSVRGAIKTAVFEYEEIQAVGGAFLFRPSSTIKTVEYEVYSGEGEGIETTDTFYHYENGNKVYEDLIVTVEKPLMFREKEWVKISNYNSMGTDPAADLTTYGLVHIYQIGEIISTEDEGSDEGSGPDEPVSTFAEITGETSVVNENNENGESDEEDDTSYEPVSSYKIVLTGGCAILESVSLENVPGGALISFGRDTTTYQEFVPASEANPSELGLYELVNNEYVLTEDTTVIEDKVYYKNFYENGRHNYGIGVNSSDNYVNLPARAISLFETTIHPNDTTKVTYNYRGILGTLPQLPYEGDKKQVDPLYHNYMEGTQGIFTNNMYIGDENQFVAFYEDDDGKQLKIKANQIMFEVSDPKPGEDPYKDIAEIAEGADGEDAIYIMIDSTGGNFFNRGQIQTSLIAHVYRGSEEITNQFNTFNWYRRLPNGQRDPSWTTQETSNQLDLNTADVDERAVFVCEVVIN